MALSLALHRSRILRNIFRCISFQFPIHRPVLWCRYWPLSRDRIITNIVTTTVQQSPALCRSACSLLSWLYWPNFLKLAFDSQEIDVSLISFIFFYMYIVQYCLFVVQVIMLASSGLVLSWRWAYYNVYSKIWLMSSFSYFCGMTVVTNMSQEIF